MKVDIRRRERVDLAHKVIQGAKLGKLQGVLRIPVVAGDSMSGEVSCYVRMNPLRRPVPFDVRADLYGFFTPYWHRYGVGIYTKFNAQSNLSTTDVPALTAKGPIDSCLMACAKNQTFPSHVADDVIEIWNHFFRDPHETALAKGALDGADTDGNKYGLTCGALKALATTGMGSTIGQGAAGDRQIPIGVTDATKNQYYLDVAQVPQQIAEWQEEQLRQWTASRVEEAFQRLFGVKPPDVVDAVPEYLGHTERWLSATDIDGTAGDQFGSAIGKMVGHVRWRLPRRMFREHGTLRVFLLLRPSPVFDQEKQYLDNPTRFRDFNRLWGSYEGTHKLPEQWNIDDLFWDGASNKTLGWYPAYAYYRSHPSFSSTLLETADTGWEARPTPATRTAAWSVPSYDDVFASTVHGHALAHCMNTVSADRIVSDSMESIMGGTT